MGVDANQLSKKRPGTIKDRGLARHVGDKDFSAGIRSGRGRRMRRRHVVGELVKNEQITYEGQNLYAIKPKDGSKRANLVPDRTRIGFYRKVDGEVTGTMLFYDYVS